jgi:hypothetical protein
MNCKLQECHQNLAVLITIPQSLEGNEEGHREVFFVAVLCFIHYSKVVVLSYIWSSLEKNTKHLK